MTEDVKEEPKTLTREQYKEIEQRRAQDDMQALLDHADATIPEEEVVIVEPEEAKTEEPKVEPRAKAKA